MKYTQDDLLAQCTLASQAKENSSDIDLINCLQRSSSLEDLFVLNKESTSYPQDKYISFLKGDDGNYVLFDFDGIVTAFASPLIKPLIYTPRPFPSQMEGQYVLAQSYGEYYMYKTLEIPVIYTPYDLLLDTSKVIKGKEVLIMRNYNCPEMFIDTNDLDLAKIKHRNGVDQQGCNTFSELFRTYDGSKIEIMDALSKIFSQKALDPDQIEEMEDTTIIKPVKSGYGYQAMLGEAPTYQFINFHIAPISVIDDPTQPGYSLWNVRISFGDNAERLITINPASVFSSPDKFTMFVFSVNGIYQKPPKKASDKPVIQAFYKYLQQQFPKKAKSITKIGYSLIRQQLVYPGLANPRYETKEFLNTKFKGYYPTVFKIKPKNIWECPEVKQHLYNILLSTGYAHESWTKEECFSPVGVAAWIWSFAGFYSAFMRRDYGVFPGFNIFGDPSSGKSYLFTMIKEAYGCEQCVMAANSTSAGTKTILDYFNSGFFIVDELTKENQNETYVKEIIGIYRNANNGQSRIKMDTTDNKGIITQEVEVGMGIGGEVEVEDAAARGRSISFSMPKRTQFSEEVRTIEPNANGDVRGIRPYLAYLLLNINEVSWQEIRIKIVNLRKSLKKEHRGMDARAIENWSMLFAFAGFFMETQAEIDRFIEMCIPRMQERSDETVAGHFASVVDIGLNYILNSDRDGDLMYRNSCYYNEEENTFNFRSASMLNYASLQERVKTTGNLAIHSYSQLMSSALNCPFVIKPPNRGRGDSLSKEWNHTKIMKYSYGETFSSRELNVCGYKLDMNLLPRHIKELIEEAEAKFFNAPQKSQDELDEEDEMAEIFN